MVINTQSPFNFLEELEIKEINFILGNKYVYYKLKNKNSDKYYHGILDIELNQIIFNTNETINVFIPFDNKSMLAITPETAYRICIYKNGTECTDYCPEGYKIDIKGSRCGISCSPDQIKLMPEEICSNNCETSIKIINNQECGLCEYFYPERPFKFINGNNCLSSIPEGAELYNNKSSLIKCKEGYHFQNDSCFDCYYTCKDCLETSMNENDQKCTKCKINYLLEKGNCLSQCSFGFEKVEDECHPCSNYTCKNFLTNSCNCSECNEGYYLEEHQCKKCSDNCKNCDNFTKCNTCNNNYVLENNICNKFHENCEICFAPSYNEKEQKCLSCKNKSMLLLEDNCVNNCPEGFYINNNKECKACNKHCKTCEQGEENNNEHCLSCDINSEYKYLIDVKDYGKNCVKDCPSETTFKEGKCVEKESKEENESKNTDHDNDNEKDKDKDNNYDNGNEDDKTLLISIPSSIVGFIIIIVVIILIYRRYKKRLGLNIKDRDVLIKELDRKLEVGIFEN